MFRRLAARGPRGPSTRGRRVVAVVLGWLVLMTVWGFGRAWHGGMAPVELGIGVLAGGVAAAVAWPRRR